MSGTDGPAAAADPVAAPGRIPEWAGWVGLGLLAIGCAGAELGQSSLALDAGIVNSEAVRYARGDVPFRDVFNATPPAPQLLLALCYYIFGVKLWIAPALLAGVVVISTWLTYSLSRQLLPDWLSLLPAIVTATMVYATGHLYSHHECSTLMALGAIACCAAHLRSGSAWTMVASGVLLALTGLSLQHKGAFLLIAIYGHLTCFGGPQGRRLRPMLLLTGGLAIVGVVLFAFLFATDATGHAIYNVVVFPLTNYLPSHYVPYPWTTPFEIDWVKLLRSPVSMVSGGCWQILLLTLIHGPLILHPVAIWILWRDPDRMQPERKIVWLYLLCGIALFAATVHSFRLKTLMHASPLMWILLGSVLCRGTGWTAALRRAFYLLLVSAAVVVGLGVSLKTWRHPRVPVQTAAGRINTSALMAREVQLVQRTLEGRIRPGDYLFCYYHISIFYLILDVRNPTRYAIMFEGYLSEDQEREIEEDLVRHKPRYVLRHRNYLHHWPGIPRIDTYLDRTYRKLAQGGRIEIWELRSR